MSMFMVVTLSLSLSPLLSLSFTQRTHKMDLLLRFLCIGRRGEREQVIHKSPDPTRNMRGAIYDLANSRRIISRFQCILEKKKITIIEMCFPVAYSSRVRTPSRRKRRTTPTTAADTTSCGSHSFQWCVARSLCVWALYAGCGPADVGAETPESALWRHVSP